MKQFRMTFTILLVMLVTNVLYGQETTPATGGEAIGIGGSSSYTVGQVNYITNVGVNGSVAQGVQQPYEIFVDTVGLESTKINMELVVYPNPANNVLILKIGNYNNEKLVYQLRDMQGRLMSTEQVFGSSSTIDMKDLPVSTYLLNILNDTTLIKVFRIVKH